MKKTDRYLDPVFILNSMRSGSELLRTTLDKLPEVVGLPETYFFEFMKQHERKSWQNEADRVAIIQAWVSYFKIQKYPINHSDLRERLIEEAEDWPSMLTVTIDHYIETCLPEKLGHQLIWCEKSPPHIFHQDRIEQLFPHARRIYMVRDPRAVVASLKTCSWSTSNVVINANVWRNGVAQMQENERCLIVRYENLVDNPKAELDRIANFLQVQLPERVLREKGNDVVIRQSTRSQAALEPINTKHRDKWKNLLSGPDREGLIIESICQNEMAQLGYEQVYLGKQSKDKSYWLSWGIMHMQYALKKILRA